MNSNDDLLPIRFWWGFKRRDVSRVDFLGKLASVFLPTTVQVMSRRLGALTGYLPIVPADHGCIDVPDELALVVYRSIAEYEQASGSLEGRAYQLLHDSVFAPPSSSKGFPVRFKGNLESNQPYFLWSQSADWMGGHSSLLLGRRPAGVSAEKFAENVTAALNALAQVSEDRKPSTVLVRVSKNCLSYVELWAGTNIPNGDCFNTVASTVNTIMSSPAAPVAMPADLNEKSWLHLSDSGEFLNLQF